MDFLVSCCNVKSPCSFVVACLLVIEHLAVSYQACLISVVMCFFLVLLGHFAADERPVLD